MDKRITFRIKEDETYFKIQQAAQQLNISISDLIREALIYYLDRAIIEEEKSNG